MCLALCKRDNSASPSRGLLTPVGSFHGILYDRCVMSLVSLQLTVVHVTGLLTPPTRTSTLSGALVPLEWPLFNIIQELLVCRKTHLMVGEPLLSSDQRLALFLVWYLSTLQRLRCLFYSGLYLLVVVWFWPVMKCDITLWFLSGCSHENITLCNIFPQQLQMTPYILGVPHWMSVLMSNWCVGNVMPSQAEDSQHERTQRL